MTRQYVPRSNQSGQKDTDSSILQRTAVRSLPAKTLKVQTESQAIGSERIKQDLTQIPVSHNDTPEVQQKLMVGSRGRSGDSGKQRMPVQAKLAIGQPDDKYEREADRAGKQVVQQLHGPQSRQLQQQQTLPLRKPMLQHQGDGVPMAAAPELESAIARSRSSGQPLSDRIREPMEKAFGGVDFSGVKVHADGTSDRLNQSIQAKAFTTGQDVFFRQGAYNPGSQGGKELLAHELTHVVQQGGVGEQYVQRKPEQEEGNRYKDSEIPGLTLTLLTTAEEVNQRLSNSEDHVSDSDLENQNYFRESYGNKLVTWSDGQYYDVSTYDTWVPQIPDFQWQGRESYVYNQGELVKIEDIKYQKVGNPKEEKQDAIWKAITGGIALPPIVIDGEKKLRDGRNRIEASIKAKYTHIPVEYEEQRGVKRKADNDNTIDSFPGKKGGKLSTVTSS